MKTNAFGALFGALLIAVSVQDSTAYSKYGRSCKDIGCQSDETCVIREDPCTAYSGDRCGHYPTCQKVKERGCTSIVCGENEYCRTVNGVPKCVERGSGSGFESAGVTYVNGQRINGGNDASHANSQPNPNSQNNRNPYANANAPPVPLEPSGSTNYHQVNTGTNLGYPAYPNNAGSSSNNNGYPPYPSTNQGNQQYHPINPALPGQQGYPAYPQQPGQQQYPAGQKYPTGQYPGYQNYPYQNYPQQNQRGFGYDTPSVRYGRPNAAATLSISLTFISFIVALVLFAH